VTRRDRAILVVYGIPGVPFRRGEGAKGLHVTPPPDGIRTRAQWARLLVELAAVFAIFHWSASFLGSDRGQAGLVVGALVVTVTLLMEGARSAQTPGSAARALGLAAPRLTGMAASLGICVLLLLVVPLFARLAGASVALETGSGWLLPGLFAQAGIAEETLFRGYLFRLVRNGRSFWRAAGLSMLPFVAVHLLLFATMPWAVALAALLLSVVLSFPLAHLFELGGATIWPPALLHLVVQGTVKILVFSGDASSLFPIVWMASSALFPLVGLAIPRPTLPDGAAPPAAYGP
jgi:membrane protease YdiL (CAAX protease family)